MRAKEEAFRILESALSIASAGVDDAEVSLGGGDLGVTRFADNQIHPSSEHNIESIAVRVAARGRMVTVQTTDLSTNGIKEIAQQAKTRVEHLPEGSETTGFPEPQNYDFVEAYDPETEATKAIDRTAMASRAIVSALKNQLTASGLVMVRRGVLGLDNQSGVYAVANTRGLLAYHPETRIRYSVSMHRKTGASGWAEDESFTSTAIDPESLVAVATNKALVGGEPRELRAATYPAVLEAAAVGELVRWIGLLAGGLRARTGGSFFSDRKQGDRLTSDSITIIDDHSHPLHRGVPFDLEGVARQRVMLIENGKLGSPVYAWDTAAKLEAQATGHKVRHPFYGEMEAAMHLVMEGGDATLSDMIGSLDRGVLVSRFGGMQLLDPRTLELTGVTRDGLFLVQKGEIVAPLVNMRFTVSVLDLLDKVEALGSSVWTRGGVVPPIRVGGLNLHAGTQL